MHENKVETITKALLISLDTGEFDAESSVSELCELAKTAGAETVGVIIQKRPAPDAATCIGSGRLAEAAQQAESLGADLIIFDCELTAAQIRNIEDVMNIRVIDRTMLILDIFAGRAITKEGRVQVELAQQKYLLPRLSGIGASLSRLGGGIGTRGPGETKLETDRRHIRRRIAALESELRELEKRRELTRARRRKDSVLSVAIVGYTNAGKSTLLNALTGAGVLTENKLFATLDITARGLELPDGRTVLLFDTVGLISRLPHNLVEAFKSTLEEAANADLILDVVDISDEDAAKKAELTRSILSELGCDGIPRITVLNKCDLAPVGEGIDSDTTVRISAKNGKGLDRLLLAVAQNLPKSAERMRLLIPYDNAALIAKIRESGKILSESYSEDGILIDASVDFRLVNEARAFSVRL